MATTRTITRTSAKAQNAFTSAAKAKAKAKAKASAKAPAKSAATIANAAAYAAAMVADRIAKGSAFYARAISYHKAQNTAFPRARNASRIAALTIEQVDEVARKHDARILAAGDGIGQACFDAYMVSKA